MPKEKGPLPMTSKRPAIFVVLLLLCGPAAAQGQGDDALEEARRLRDAGRFDRAVPALRERLTRAPDDVDARWLLAQTLYWTGDVEGARSEYARAHAERPDDPGLRLDYARFLLDTGRAGEARRVLTPLAERAPPGWEGEVERIERAILARTAPWARVAPRVRDDSQPLTRLAVEVEAGWWPAEGLSVALRATPERYEGDLGVSGVERELTGAEAVAAVAYRRAGSPLAVEVSGGVFTRDRPEATEAIGGAEVAVRLPRALALRGRASREPYLWTVSSLSREVRVDGLELALDRSGAPGWAFEAGVRRETFDLGRDPSDPSAPRTSGGDDNAVSSAWAWVLAPLRVRERVSLRAGYAFQWQDAEETRFTGEGIYDPYYTPEGVRVHSAVAAIAVRASPAVALHADGTVGFGRERAPREPPVTAPAPGRGRPGGGVEFADRDFVPWRARATLVAGIGAAGELRAEVERSEGAFFESTRGEVSLTWRMAR